MNISKKKIDLIVRAFWRRIYLFRNDFDQELPPEVPVELSAHLVTALMHLEDDILILSTGEPVDDKLCLILHSGGDWLTGYYNDVQKVFAASNGAFIPAHDIRRWVLLTAPLLTTEGKANGKHTCKIDSSRPWYRGICSHSSCNKYMHKRQV